MKREALVLLGLSVVTIPAAAEACSACVTEGFREVLPGLDPIAAVLLVWLLAHFVLTVIPAGAKRIVNFIAYSLIIGFLCAAMGGIPGVMFAILVCMVLDLNVKVAAYRSGNWFLLDRLGLGAAVLALLVSLTVGSVIQYRVSKLDPLDRFMTYGPSQGYMKRNKALSFALDPEFDVERLRPALEAQGEQGDLALLILTYRPQPAHDVLRFADVLVRYPETSLRGDPGAPHDPLRQLLVAADLPTIDSSAELTAWVAATKGRAQAAANTGDSEGSQTH